jgi:hypothetical protein
LNINRNISTHQNFARPPFFSFDERELTTKWLALLESGNEHELNRLATKFIENDSAHRPWHLHITLQPLYYDRWADSEMKELVTHTEYLLCKEYLHPAFAKFCLEDRFHGRVCFHGQQGSKDRHCHIVYYIPFHMMTKKTSAGRKPMNNEKSFLTSVVRQTFMSHYIKVYSMSPDRLWKFRRSFRNKDDSINAFRKEENSRLRLPYIQTIKQTDNDRQRVTAYDMKESHRRNRHDDIHFTNNNRSSTP